MSSISAGTTSTTTLVHSGDTTGSLVFKTNDTGSGGTTAVTIDTSQNVGIGTTSPSGKLDVKTGTGANFRAVFSTTNQVEISNYSSASGYQEMLLNGSPLTFYTGTAGTGSASERMRIDSSGNLLVGTTTNNNSERLMVRSSGSTSATTALRIENSSATAMFLVRDDGYLRSPTTYNLTGGTANLSIDASGFITRATSSLRYKKDIVNYDKGLAVLNQLRPVYYKSSVAGADGNIPDTQFAGMIAEELDALGLTEFIEYGAENQVEAIRYGNMVSLCIKAIQEQQALITAQAETINALTARVVALESK